MNGRWVVAVLVGIAVVIAFGISLLPRAGPREIMRHQVEVLLERILPAPVVWKRVEIFLEPPAIRVTELVAGLPDGAVGVWRAESAWVEVAPGPLRRGVVEVENVKFSRLAIDVLRHEGAGENRGSSPQAEPSFGEAAVLDFGVLVEEASLRFEDRNFNPPLRIVVPEASLQLVPGEKRSTLTGSARLAAGGRIVAQGEASASQGVDLVLQLEDIAGSLFSPLAGFLRGASGTVSGETALHRSPEGAWDGEASLRAEDVRLAMESLEVDGPIGLHITLEAEPGDPIQGEILVDAREAALVFEEAYRKPVGKPARLRADFEFDSSGSLKLGDFKLLIGERENP